MKLDQARLKKLAALILATVSLVAAVDAIDEAILRDLEFFSMLEVIESQEMLEVAALGDEGLESGHKKETPLAGAASPRAADKRMGGSKNGR